MSDLTEVIVDAALARLKPWTDNQYGDLFAIAAERAVRIVLMEAESVYRSDERATVAEEVATDILARLAAIGLRPTPWADGYTLASQYAAAVSRKHAAKAPGSHGDATEPPPESERTSNTAETLSDGRKRCGCVGKCPNLFLPCPVCQAEVTAVEVDSDLTTTYHPCRHTDDGRQEQ